MMPKLDVWHGSVSTVWDFFKSILKVNIDLLMFTKTVTNSSVGIQSEKILDLNKKLVTIHQKQRPDIDMW